MRELKRILQILDCFTPECPVVSAEWFTEKLGASRASIYRDLQQLAMAGLIERLDERGYALGPRVVQMDRQIRLGDPLLQAAAELPQTLALDSGGVVLLCRLHANTVLCILEASPSGPGLNVSYERGRAMPLYKGATSKVILANLQPHRLGELIHSESLAIRQAGLPETAEGLHAALQEVRHQGYAITQGEVDPDVTGIAVPLMLGKRLLGSLSVVLPQHRCAPGHAAKALNLLRSTARRIEARMEENGRKIKN